MNYSNVSDYIKNINGFMGSEAQREFMFNLGKMTDCAAEIGSFKGLSAAIVLLGMVNSGKSEVPSYYCIDTFEASNIELNDESTFDEFKKVIDAIDKYGIVKPIKGYSTDENVIKQIPNNLDWIYIDGSHETEDVIKDIELYVPLVKTNGLLLFHDYTWDTVRVAVELMETKGLISLVCVFDDFAVYKKK